LHRGTVDAQNAIRPIEGEVNMARSVLSFVLVSLSCLALPQGLRADPVRITSGQMIITGTNELGSLDIAGERGFSLRAGVLNAPDAFWDCFDPECFPGSPLSLFVNLGGPTLGSATATIDGQTYTDIDTLTSSVSTNTFFQGSAVAPAYSDAGATISAPFTFDGAMYLDYGNVTVDLAGSGMATLRLIPYGLPDFGPAWRVDQIDYLFGDPNPVPEPGTMTLAATALAGASMARRRARRRGEQDAD
jgi:hypothetical protein